MYKVGEEIEHKKFGTGKVKEIRIEGEDTLIDVNFFNNFGLKKLLLKGANQYITRLSDYSIYNAETNELYNKEGYNEAGYDKLGFDVFGYNIKGIHKSENMIKIINQKIPLNCELRFDGFYHMTHLDNAGSIFKQGKLISRSRRPMLYDMNEAISITHSVLSKTPKEIQDYVRLYFRPKTPTFWHFENIKDVVVLLKFSPKLLTYPKARISIGNASKSTNKLLSVNEDNISNIDFTNVFKSSTESNTEYERNLIQTELLIPFELDLYSLEEIIFRNKDDMFYFRGKFGHQNGILYRPQKSKFFKGNYHVF